MTKAAVFRWYVVALLACASVLGYMDRLVVGFLIDPIKADIGMTDLQGGMLTGLAFSLFYVTMGIPIGRMIDTRPKNIILGLCILVWSSMTMLGGMAHSFLTLFLARCGVGAGEGGLNPAAISIMGDTFPPEKLPVAVSIFNLGLWIGGGLAIVLGGQLVAYFATVSTIALPGLGVVPAWRLVLISVGLPGIFLAILIVLTLKPARGDTAVQRPTADLATVLRFYRQEYATITMMVIGYSLYLFLAYSILAWAPAMLMRTYGASQSTVSLAYGLPYLFAGIAGALLAPVLTMMARGRYGAVAPLAVAKWAAAVGFVPAVLAPLMPTMTLCIVGLTITIFLWAVTASSMMTSLTLAFPPAMRGLLWAIQTLITNLTAATLGPMLVGALSDNVFGPKHLGYAMSLEALITFPAAIALFTFAQPRFGSLVQRLAGTREAAVSAPEGAVPHPA